MKTNFITFILLFACYFSLAQSTNAELSENNFDQKGYHFNFNQYSGENPTITADQINCINDGTPKYSPQDISIKMHSTCSWLQISFDGTGSNWVPLGFTTGNCDKSKQLDLSSYLDGDTIKAPVEIRLMAPQDVKIYFALGSDNLGSAQNHNVSYDKQYFLKANEWTVITINDFLIGSWSGTKIDPSEITAFDLQIQNTVLDLYIDYIYINSNGHNDVAIDRNTNNSDNCTITELNETSTNNNINVFPNPTKNILNFAFETPVEYKITILNQLGQQVKEIEKNSNFSLDISDLKPGIYYVEFISSNTISKIERIIIE